jgi:NRPS condensation-like uncharacterized protein
MTHPKTYKAEAFDVMQYYYNRAQEPLVRCLVRLDGHADERALKRAVTLTAQAAPLIFCRFDISPRQPRWVEAGYTAEQAVRVVEADADAPDFASRLLAATSLDIFHEPLVKILIIRGEASEASDTLCILMSHLVCDGGGFKDYLYLLCDLYARCAEDPAYSCVLTPAPRSLKQLSGRFTVSQQRRILFPGKGSEETHRIPVVNLQGDPNEPFIAERVIPAGRFAGVRARAKALDVTMNDLLLAAYLRALSEATGERALTLPCPVDLRKYLRDSERRFCNLTGNLFCSVEIEPEEPFEATARKVSAAMGRQKDSTVCLRGPLKLRYLYPLLSFKEIGRNFNRYFSIPVTSYTNLGMLDESRFRFAGVSIIGAYMTGAIKRKPYFQVAASTYADCCTLTCNLCGTPQDRAFIDRFLERIEQEMAGEGQNP